MSKAYIIFLESFLESIENHTEFGAYRRQVSQALEPYGGRFIIRGGHYSVIEGDWPYERCVVIEFSSQQDAEAWYWSPEYRNILPLRLSAMQASAVIIDGIAPT